MSKTYTPFLKADAKPLAATIRKVLPVVARKSSVPILTHALLSTADARLAIRGNNLDVEVETSVGVEVLEEAALAIDPRVLLRLLRSVAGEVVTLALDDERRLVVSWSDGRAALHTLPAADFPAFEISGSAHAAQLPPTFVSEVLDPVRHCISTEETRYYLNGVVLDRAPDGCPVLCATDGHRLRAAPAPGLGAAIEAAGNRRPIVRREFVSLWRDAAFGKAATLTLFADEKRCAHVAVETEGLKIASKLIDGAFPDWHRVVPSGAETQIVAFDRASFLLAARRIALVSGARPGHSQNVAISFEEGRATLRSQTFQFGEVECSTSCDGALPGPLGVSAGYLVSALERARGTMVTLRAVSPADPVVIAGSEDPAGTMMIVMPLRVLPRAQEVKEAA
jgi:DNA polymerase-3 subunit beta